MEIHLFFPRNLQDHLKYKESFSEDHRYSNQISLKGGYKLSVSYLAANMAKTWYEWDWCSCSVFTLPKSFIHDASVRPYKEQTLFLIPATDWLWVITHQHIWTSCSCFEPSWLCGLQEVLHCLDSFPNDETLFSLPFSISASASVHCH